MRRILVVDDHAMVRKGLISILSLQQYCGQPLQCDEAGTAEEALEQLERHSYALVLLDISMPGQGGLELLPFIRAQWPDTRVLMLSMFPEEQFALRALKLGASGYLTKKEAADELVLAVEQICAGKRYLSQQLSDLFINQALDGSDTGHPSHTSLSNREFQILRQLAEGKSLKAIALELDLSIKTVSTYKSRLFIKMVFASDADLIAYANSNNLL